MTIPLEGTFSVNLRPVKAAYFAFFVAFGLYVAYINVYYRSIGMSGTQIGLISSVIPLVAMLSGPVWGLLSDVVGKARWLMVIAGVGSLAAMLGLSAVTVFAWILPLAALHSLFNGNIPPMIDSVNLGMLGEHRERYGQARIWGSLGYILSTLGFGLILRQVGLHWMFYAYAAVSLGFLVTMVWMPGQSAAFTGSPWKALIGLIRQPQWLFLSAALLFIGMAHSGMNNFLGVSLSSMGASASLIGAAASIGAMAEIPVMLYSGHLIRRLGLKRMLVFAFLVYALRFALYAWMPSPVWALPIALLHGFTYGVFWVASVMYASRLAPENLRATAQTLLVAVLNLANVVGAPLGGYVFDTSGPHQLFGMYALITLAGLLVLLAGFWYSRRLDVHKTRVL